MCMKMEKAYSCECRTNITQSNSNKVQVIMETEEVIRAPIIYVYIILNL